MVHALCQLKLREFTGFSPRKAAELSGNPDLSVKSNEPPRGAGLLTSGDFG
jgi:hypothetical protein